MLKFLSFYVPQKWYNVINIVIGTFRTWKVLGLNIVYFLINLKIPENYFWLADLNGHFSTDLSQSLI